MDTRKKIIDTTRKKITVNSLNSVGIRDIAQDLKISTSVIYYHFENKDELMHHVFVDSIITMGNALDALPQSKNPSKLLRQRIEYQFDYALHIVATLKYFMEYKKEFKKQPGGYVPQMAYRHIIETLQYGVDQNEFEVKNIIEDAKVITHAINGFILEYFPNIPTGKERTAVIDAIHDFILRAVKK